MSDEDRSMQNELHQQILDVIPAWILVVDPQMRMLYCNSAARRDLSADSKDKLLDLCGNVMHCVHALDSAAGCGSTEHCEHCVIRSAVGQAAAGNGVHRQKHLMVLEKEGVRRAFNFLISASQMPQAAQPSVLVTIENISLQVDLQSLVAICSHCKKVRLDREQWTRIEAYLYENYQLEFTHGICPSCADEHYSVEG